MTKLKLKRRQGLTDTAITFLVITLPVVVVIVVAVLVTIIAVLVVVVMPPPPVVVALLRCTKTKRGEVRAH